MELKRYRVFDQTGIFVGFYSYREDSYQYLTGKGWDLEEVGKNESIAVSEAMWNVIRRYVPKEEFDKDADVRVILALITDRFVDVRR